MIGTLIKAPSIVIPTVKAWTCNLSQATQAFFFFLEFENWAEWNKDGVEQMYFAGGTLNDILLQWYPGVWIP